MRRPLATYRRVGAPVKRAQRRADRSRAGEPISAAAAAGAVPRAGAHTTCDGQRATDNVQQTACNRQRATDNVQQTTCNRQRATDNETTWYTASGGCGVPFGQAGAGTNRPTGMRRSVRHVRIGCVCRLVQHCHVADCAAYNLQQHATTCDNMQQHVACMPQPAWDCRQHGGRVRGCPCGYPHTNPEGNCSVALQRIATPPSVEGRPCGRCVGRGAS